MGNLRTLIVSFLLLQVMNGDSMSKEGGMLTYSPERLPLYKLTED
jgi:hypothetical protein